MSSAPQLRLFFALWPDDGLRRDLLRATRSVVRAAGGRPVQAANLHITLAFLGAVPGERLERLKTAAGSVTGAPFDLVLKRVGYFGRARSLWLGPDEPCPALDDLVGSLWDALTAAGWQRERRAFIPHLTLARKARPAPADVAVKPVRWPVRGFSLIQSVTHSSGAVYQELASWPFTVA